MLVDLLGQGRVLFVPVQELSVENIPKFEVKDGAPNIVYVNSRIAEGSVIGSNCFLIACDIGDRVRFGKEVHLYKSRVGNAARIWDNAVVDDNTVFGNEVSFTYGAVVGNGCRFGNDINIGSNSSFGGNCIFGDGAQIHHNNTFYDSCEFGKGTSIGAGNVFYGCPKFGDMPKLWESEKTKLSVRIFERPSTNLRDPNSREVMLLREYLQGDERIWLKPTK